MWRRTLDRLIQTLVILLIAYYTVIGGFVAGVREYPWRLTTEIITFLLVGGWLLKKLIRRENLPATPFDLPILALIISSILSAAFSTDPRVSWENVLLNALFGLLFYFSLELALNHSLKLKIINAVLVISGVITLIGLIEFWEWYGGSLLNDVNWRSTALSFTWDNLPRIKSILQNPNYLAYFLLIPLGLSLGKIANSTHQWQRLAWICYFLMTLIPLVLTRSRGGSLGGIILFAGFMGLLWLTYHKTSLPQLWRRPQFIIIGITVFVIAYLFLYIITSRINFSDLSLAGILNERLDFWRASINMVAAQPITGVGPGTYPMQYLLYRDLSRGGVAFIITHAHNLWFTILAEYGLLGIIIVFWTMILFIRIAYTALKQPSNRAEAVWLVTALAVITGQATHNLFDDFLEFPVYTWYTILLVTICLVPQQARLQPAAFHLPWRFWLGLVSGVMIVLGAFWFNRGFAAYHQAVLASQNDNWPQTATWLEQAVNLDPTNKFYQQQLALSYGWLAHTDQSWLPRAIAAQQRVIDQQTTYPLDYAHLACLHWQQGDTALAIKAMRHAVAAEAPVATYAGLKSWHTSQVTYHFNLGYYYESSGDLEQAQAHYQQSILQRPEIAVSIFWNQTPFRLQMRQKIMDNENVPTVPYLDLVSSPESVQAQEKAIQTAAVLTGQGASPIIYYQWGRLAEAQHNLDLAKKKYQEAIFRATAIDTDYANLIGRREPLAQEKMPCLLLPYAEQELSAPSLRLAALYQAAAAPELARDVYINLLLYEPYNSTAQEKLASLCADAPQLCAQAETPGP